MMMKNKKILILVPGVDTKGGVVNYYLTAKDNFTLDVEYFTRGARNCPERKNVIFELIRLIKDFWRFFLLFRKKKYDLLQTSTSFSSLAILRDGVFIIIAKFFKAKVIVFYRGWDKNFVKKMEKRYFYLYKWIFFKADAFIDLAKENMDKLNSWGYKNKIYLETTIVNEKLVKDISEKFIMEKYNKKKTIFNILFLARLERAKGIYEAVNSFKILKSKYNNLTLTIAGEGFELDKIKNHITRNSLEGIIFLGHVSGENKIKAYKDADIYLFPSYSEGMPTSVLEAMAFGLPVITTPVGGLVDFFIDGKNGFITKNMSPENLAYLIEKLLEDKDLMLNISVNNFKYAKERFLASKVIERIEKIYLEVLSN